MTKAFYVWFIFHLSFEGCCGWLWWNPASEMDTYNKCKEMKEKEDMWYPTYCDDLIYKHEENQPNKVQTYSGSLSNPGTTRSPDSKSRLPEDIIGWGWSEWGEWGDGGCPDICGRRCNRRARYCHGPYNLICKGRGSIQDYDDCEELESNDQGGGFERSSTISDEALMQQQIGNEAGELPDYENSLQNLLRLDQTLQQLEGLLGKRMGSKRNRFKKKRLIKPSVQNISSISAISEER